MSKLSTRSLDRLALQHLSEGAKHPDTLPLGLISDGCTSVTRSTCLAYALNELNLTPEDQTQVSDVMNAASDGDMECECCEGGERFDLYLTGMVNVAQRYLPTDSRLVLRYSGPDEDDWFGVVADRLPVSRRYDELSTVRREVINSLINALASEPTRPMLSCLQMIIDEKVKI
jgi:hypothetical protein